MELAGLFYGLLLSFVFSAARHNRREGRTHSRMLVYVGYVLCGLSAGVALALPLFAALHPDALAVLFGR